MTDTFRGLCAELLDCDDGAIFGTDLVTRAHAALAEPVGERPSDEELDLLVIAIQALVPHQPDATTHNLASVNRGREILSAALSRWGRPTTPPAPEPVAVAEKSRISIDEMCEILRFLEIRVTEYTDCATLYEVTFDQLRAICNTRAATLLQQQSAPAPVVVPVAELSPKEVEAQDAFTQMRDEVLNLSDGVEVNEVLGIIDNYTPEWV
jgi:hypothetical protein